MLIKSAHKKDFLILVVFLDFSQFNPVAFSRSSHNGLFIHMLLILAYDYILINRNKHYFYTFFTTHLESNYENTY